MTSHIQLDPRRALLIGRAKLAAYFRAAVSPGEQRYLEALRNGVPVRHSRESIRLHFANDYTTLNHEYYDPLCYFNVGRYLAQRFPPLRDSTRVPFGPIFRWPEQWQLEQTDCEILYQLVQLGMDPVDFNPDQTVLEALQSLDSSLVATLRRHLPKPVVTHLGGWLRDQWSGYRALLPPLDRLRAQEELLTRLEPRVPGERRIVFQQCLSQVQSLRQLYEARVSDEIEFWEDYFWQFVSLLSDTSLRVGPSRLVAPALVGRLEAFACRRIEMGEPGVREWFVSQWEHFGCPSCQLGLDRLCRRTYGQDYASLGELLRQRRCNHYDAQGETDNRVIHPVHLCDRLADVFLEWVCCPPTLCMTPELAAGDSLIGLTRNDEPCLWVFYHGPGGISSWLAGRGPADRSQGALNPRDHWALRVIEIEQPIAAGQITLMVPARTYRALATLPQACGALGNAAYAVAASSRPLQEPSWLHEDTMVEVHGEALRDNSQGATTAYRDYERDYLFLASPVLTDRRAARAGLLHRTRTAWLQSIVLQLAQAAPFPEIRETVKRLQSSLSSPNELPQADWQMMSQLLAEIGRLHELQDVERQQNLADLHRRLTAVPEMVARARFQADEFTMKNPQKPKEDEKRINVLFSRWLRQAEPDVDAWDPEPGQGQSVFYSAIVQPVFGPLRKGNSTAAPVPLIDLIDRTVSNARSHGGKLGVSRLGDGVWRLLSETPGTGAWAKALDVVSEPSKDGAAELLLTAKVLFEIRNLLSHGIVADQPVNAGQVDVEHAESGTRVCLNWASLDRCLRLTVAFTHATWTR